MDFRLKVACTVVVVCVVGYGLYLLFKKENYARPRINLNPASIPKSTYNGPTVVVAQSRTPEEMDAARKAAKELSIQQAIGRRVVSSVPQKTQEEIEIQRRLDEAINVKLGKIIPTQASTLLATPTMDARLLREYEATRATDPMTMAATMSPTMAATMSPTMAATMAATMAPTMAATMAATMAPTMAATMAPTMAATMAPTMAATTAPAYSFTQPPTFPPTLPPTYPPTKAPTYDVADLPTYQPTYQPTYEPTYQPTIYPTYQPTIYPTYLLTTTPTPTIDLSSLGIAPVYEIDGNISVGQSYEGYEEKFMYVK